MILTVAATMVLFVIIPKGFFPQQDTGLIVGISEAAQNVSPDGVKQRQQTVLTLAARTQPCRPPSATSARAARP